MSFSEHLAQTSPFPIGLEVDRAEGCYIYGKDGKAYLDLISGLAVANTGHRHPHIIRAIKEQLDLYQHVIPFGEFSQSPQNLLADKLASLLPPSLNASYFVNSGTEAVEAALKLAKRVTGRHKVIAMRNSYHGATHGSLSVSGNEVKKQQFRPMVPGTCFIEFNRVDDLDAIDTQTAAVITEVVQGDAGVRIPDQAYLKALRQRCDEMGCLLIFDEIQTGFGRTGSLFAFQHYGVVPDILTVAKAFGGGMPIGAFISSKENMVKLTHDPILGHITTFGGHPVCCAAALANLEVLTEKEKWVEQVNEKGTYLKDLLHHERIKEVRQIGLMLAVELETPEEVDLVVKELLSCGYISFYFLSTRNAFRLAPPLSITSAQLKDASEAILKALDKLG